MQQFRLPAPARPLPPLRRRSGLGFRLRRIGRNVVDAPVRALTILGAVALGVAIAVAIIAASEGMQAEVLRLLETRNADDLRSAGVNIRAVQQVLADARELLTKLAIGFTAALVGLVTWVSMGQRRREIGINRQHGLYRSEVILELVGESFILCILGGLVGLALGRALCAVIAAQLPSLPMAPSLRGTLAVFPATTLLTFGVAAGIAVAFAQRQSVEPKL